MLGPGQQKSVKLVINEFETERIDRNRNIFGFGWTSSKDFQGGTLKVSITKADGTVSEKTYDVGFTKSHPDSY
jgi:hypothetical protein